MRGIARALLLPLLVATGAGACSLTTSLDGFAGGPAASTSDAAHLDGPAESSEAGATSITSCDALKRAKPSTPDGVQLIDPDGPGPVQPFSAFCDMTNDGGGWMLVTAAMLGQETNVGATVTRLVDARGGLAMRVYVNNEGCGPAKPRTRHRLFIAANLPWTRVRMKQSFAGSASCWHLFGGLEDAATLPLDPNLVAFSSAEDVIRDAVRMGGSNGDAFDGVTRRCDGSTQNFWAEANGAALRSATVVLRRRDLAVPSGLSTGADCASVGPGETSPTWWEYAEIFIR